MSPGISHTSDEALVIRYRDTNDPAVLGELFKRHSVLCYTVCYKYLKDADAAEDATMSIFEKLFTDLRQHEIQHFRNWLHSVCRNHCLMLLRKPATTSSLEAFAEGSETLFMDFGLPVHPENTVAEKELRLQELENAIAGLKEPQRQCIELFYLKQRSYEEISRETGYTANEVKSHLQNGKRNLKITLGTNGIALCLALSVWIQLSA